MGKRANGRRRIPEERGEAALFPQQRSEIPLAARDEWAPPRGRERGVGTLRGLKQPRHRKVELTDRVEWGAGAKQTVEACDERCGIWPP